MNRKTWSTVLLAAGVVLLLLSLLADVIGLGASSAFGYRQIAGMVVGIIGAIAGYVLSRK